MLQSGSIKGPFNNISLAVFCPNNTSVWRPFVNSVTWVRTLASQTEKMSLFSLTNFFSSATNLMKLDVISPIHESECCPWAKPNSWAARAFLHQRHLCSLIVLKDVGISQLPPHCPAGWWRPTLGPRWESKLHFCCQLLISWNVADWVYSLTRFEMMFG